MAINNQWLIDQFKRMQKGSVRNITKPPKPDPAPTPVPSRLRGCHRILGESVDRCWEMLGSPMDVREQLLDKQTVMQMRSYQHNIENFVGTVKVPVGVAGPLRVKGSFARGDFYVPLATSEATLVACYDRGARVVSEAGGAEAAVLAEGVGRSPVFVFATITEVQIFTRWLTESEDEIRRIAESTTRYGRLNLLSANVEGHNVFVLFLFSTGDAAGQNIVTIAVHEAVEWIKQHTPVDPRSVYLESNFSGDKKASEQVLQGVRGRKVVAEVNIPRRKIEKILHTSSERMAECARLGTTGSLLSGTVGAQAQFANGLAAMFIACGQDAASVAEAAVGTTNFEVNLEGDLYASVTLPNLIVGTIGGGTGLPSQNACLRILGLSGGGNANAFAEVAACLCLAGEISLVASLASNDFARAHAMRRPRLQR